MENIGDKQIDLEMKVKESHAAEAHKDKKSIARGNLLDRKAIKDSRKVTRREKRKPKKEDSNKN
jgi:hypothetical protein